MVAERKHPDMKAKADQVLRDIVFAIQLACPVALTGEEVKMTDMERALCAIVPRTCVTSPGLTRDYVSYEHIDKTDVCQGPTTSAVAWFSEGVTPPLNTESHKCNALSFAILYGAHTTNLVGVHRQRRDASRVLVCALRPESEVGNGEWCCPLVQLGEDGTRHRGPQVNHQHPWPGPADGASSALHGVGESH